MRSRPWPRALLLTAVAAALGCSPQSRPTGMDATDTRFLALGDSYTIGEGVPPAERWPVQLAALLRERGFDVGEPAVIARTGWTTDELSAAIDQADPRGPFDLVSLLIGVNNQYRGRSEAEYRGDFRGLLRRAVALAGERPERVLVLSIPDWGVTPFAEGRDRARIAAEIDRFNAANREIARELGARYVDVTPVSRRTGAGAEWLAQDRLHPSGRMYAEWARLALSEAQAALE
jgi:lysophospholipase L1-like esterase